MEETYLNVDMNEFDKPMPTMDPRKVVAEFTEDSNGTITPGREKAPYLNMKHLGPGRLAITLGQGFNQKELVEYDEKIRAKGNTSFLEWIGKFSPGESLKEKCRGADIVADSAILTTIAMTPYFTSKWRSWMFVAKRDRTNDVTFIRSKETKETEQCYGRLINKKEYYATLRLAQYSTSKRNEDPDINAKLVEREKFQVILETKIQRDGRQFGLLYMSEVGCINPFDNTFVDVKLRPISFQHYFWKTSIGWSIGAHLSRTEKYLVGFTERDYRNFTVTKYGKINADKLEEEQLEFWKYNYPRSLWKRAVCFNFLASVLEKLDDFLTDHCDMDCCVVEFKPSEERVVFRYCVENESAPLAAPLKNYLGVE